MAAHKKIFSPATPEDRQLIDMAFNKKRADERKDWLKTCTPDTFLDHAASESVQISEFINKELILFSQADNVRSIPSMLDGLKPGQRKIMFACFKRKLKGEIKVMQLAGYVSEHAAYHHGEQSLCQTIVGLAQNFVGSNNLNLLEPNGQFGTRLQGGKDAASPRYIFTALSPFARAVFRPEDDPLLKYLNDDGQSIEPESYIPILPMVLVNGCEGIGTGWSTTIPSYNPSDIVQNIRRLMNGEEPEDMHPWYSGFTGSIEIENGQKYRVTGTWKKIDSTTLEITELPIGSWTQSYKEFLEGLLAADGAATLGLKDYKEHHTDSTVRFILSLTEQGMADAEREGVEKRFKLMSSLNNGNMVCFDSNGRIKKFGDNGPIHILRDFYDVRLTFYQKRKEHLASELTREWTVLDNKVRFIRDIIAGTLRVQNRPKADIEADLKSRNYEPYSNTSQSASEDSEESTLVAGVYDYLLRMPIWTLTKERVEQLETERNQTHTKLECLLAKTPKDLWRADLDEFMELWEARETNKTSQLSALRKASLTANTSGTKGKKSSNGAGKKAAVAASVLATKRISLDDSDDSVEEAEDDDYNPVTKKVTKKVSAVSEVKPKNVTKKVKTETSTLDSFISRKQATNPKPTPAPIILLDDDNGAGTDGEDLSSLPLAERISRMLSKTQHKSSSGQASLPSAKPPPITKQEAKPAAPKRAKAKIISDDSESDSFEGVSEEEEVYEISD